MLCTLKASTLPAKQKCILCLPANTQMQYDHGYCMCYVHMKEYQFKGIKIYYRHISHVIGVRQ